VSTENVLSLGKLYHVFISGAILIYFKGGFSMNGKTIEQVPEILVEGILRDQGQIESDRRSDMFYHMSRVTLTVLKIMNAGEKARITVGDFDYKASDYMVPTKLAEIAKFTTIYMNGDAMDDCGPIFQFNCDLNGFVTYNASYLRLKHKVVEQPNPNYVKPDDAKATESESSNAKPVSDGNPETILVELNEFEVNDKVISSLLLSPDGLTKAVGKMRIRGSKVNTVALDTTPRFFHDVGYLTNKDGFIVVNTGAGDISKEATAIVDPCITFISDHLRRYGKITKEGLERWAAEGAITE
jgi:hypothetical protein